jgi:hypothetical protein
VALCLFELEGEAFLLVYFGKLCILLFELVYLS